MPIYEYKRPDGTTFELMQSFSDPALKKDPETGVKVQRVLHAPAVHFKGKGFYSTDYGSRKGSGKDAFAESKDDAKPSTESKSESKGDAKPKDDSKPVAAAK
jgi:putative FmdB family regulatory protein